MPGYRPEGRPEAPGGESGAVPREKRMALRPDPGPRLGNELPEEGLEAPSGNDLERRVKRMVLTHKDRLLRFGKEELGRTERAFRCEACGFERDRDLNAAMILFRTVSSTGFQACGEGGSGSSTRLARNRPLRSRNLGVIRFDHVLESGQLAFSRRRRTGRGRIRRERSSVSAERTRSAREPRGRRP